MVIVLIIVVFVVAFVAMASEITRAAPWIFETEVIWEIVAIETIYTKTANSFETQQAKKGDAQQHPPDGSLYSSLYSAASTASPIATVPTCWQPGVRMSPVR
jgi:hypothetical protein